MPYESPGGAFVAGLQDYFARQAAEQQQAFQNQLLMRQEARQEARDRATAEQAMEALKEKRQAFEETQKDKKKAAFEKTVGGMVKGDYPTPELVQQAREFGLSHLFPGTDVLTEPDIPEPPPGIAAPVEPGAAPPAAPAAPPPNAVRPPQLGGVRFIGSQKERVDAADDEALMRMARQRPEGSPDRIQLEAMANTSGRRTLPAGTFKSDDLTDAFRVDPKRNQIQRSVPKTPENPDGWVDHSGQVPKGAHWIQQLDTSARDAAAIERKTSLDLRREGMRNQAHQLAVTELNKYSMPYEDQLKNLETAEAVLSERTASGDAHVAPTLLKAIVAGQASGFRMTQSEINQVQDARTKLQSLEAAGRKWDPSGTALFYDDKQRAEFQRLINTIRKVAQRHVNKVLKARYDVNESEDARSIQRRLTALHEELTEQDAPSAPGPAVASVGEKTPAELLKEIRAGRGGR